MASRPLILSIDQGTTSSRAILFDTDATAVFTAQREFPQLFPASGWVEHDPEAIWQSSLAVAREALAQAATLQREVVAIGITNQRETTLVWDRQSGKPVGNAIVWQDRRTAAQCEQLRAAGHETTFSERTGLLLDPYFSGTKLAWILDNIEGARPAAERGELLFGTVDSFLLWRLTGGAVHATDATNASRTLLYNIHENRWDEQLLQLLDIPASMLPEVRDCAAEFGVTASGVFDRPLPIRGIAGDQQAATIGQACFEPGMIKSTYGTGCFVVLNTGTEAVASKNRLLTTIAYQLDGTTHYAIEGSIFVAGAAVQWLRDGLGLIESAGQTEALASGLPDNRGVYLVPAFTGLGAPYWDAHARGGLFGLTRATGPAEIVRATLEAVCYQTCDLLQAMAEDGVSPTQLRVDGGMVGNAWLTQFLADVLGIEVLRPVQTETTALGAAYLAGLQSGLYGSLDELAARWQESARFQPAIGTAQRESLLQGWREAVARVRGG